MIEACNVTKNFIKQEKKGIKKEFAAVCDVSIKTNCGEILGVLGPNGAGKTTLLRMLGGLMKPDVGEVFVLDRENNRISNREVLKSYIGYLSENTKLYGRFTVRELLSVFGELYGYNKNDIKGRIEEVSETMMLQDFIDNKIEKLSTGQKQRVSISRCLLHDPENYIFDEPTLGLDIISAKSIIDFMKTEKTRGKSVIYSTHYMEEAEFLCDRIVMLNQGKIIAEGSPLELKEKYGTRNLRETFFAIVEENE
ncbi:MAG: ABC transporter ATP-binding protein [Lachnospiraceae bacterium]|nr:ABC transporter ATP-binding protein [Lachnospiraceae bacterium]